MSSTEVGAIASAVYALALLPKSLWKADKYRIKPIFQHLSPPGGIFILGVFYKRLANGPDIFGDNGFSFGQIPINDTLIADTPLIRGAVGFTCQICLDVYCIRACCTVNCLAV